MPEGQFSGQRSKYDYTTDSGKHIPLTLDDSLVVAGSGLAAFDPANPPANVTGKFDRFKPRGVYWQATDTGFVGRRKFIVCGTNNSTLFAADTQTALTIDGVGGLTTGKRGESFSF